MGPDVVKEVCERSIAGSLAAEATIVCEVERFGPMTLGTFIFCFWPFFLPKTSRLCWDQFEQRVRAG